MKNLFIVICSVMLAALTFTGCETEKDDRDLVFSDLNSEFKGKGYKIDSVIVNGDTVYVEGETKTDSLYIIITNTDTVKIIVHDTITLEPARYEFSMGSNKVDNVISFGDWYPTLMRKNGKVVLSTDINREAELTNPKPEFFLPKMEVKTTVSRPETQSSYNVRGEYDINTNDRVYTVNYTDGYQTKLSTSNEAANAMYDGENRDLLSRQVKSVRVISVKDVPTDETTTVGTTIYRKVNRTTEVEIESEALPVMGISVITKDTVKLSSENADKDSKIAVVWVEDGKTPDDTPDDIIPTPGPTPNDSTDVKPNPTPDDGYSVNGVKVLDAWHGYTMTPQGGFAKYVLVRLADSNHSEKYLEGWVNGKKVFSKKVSNHSGYNSIAWSDGAWQAAKYQNVNGNVCWTVNNVIAAAGTADGMKSQASNAGLHLSTDDFCRLCSLTHSGKTTKVCDKASGEYIMTLK
jgi:hypothetical protein